MDPLNGLLGCAGIWRGTNRLEDPHIKSPEDSFATALVSPILGGRFVRIDYTWIFYGDPQEGSILFGYEKKSDLVTAYWIDTWHLNDKVMICTGVPAEGELNVLGSYAPPTGPDWGWRIIVTPNEGKTFIIKMFNVEPEGRELFAVESQYRRGEDN
ncbi:MAG: DUF1579 family protein [Blastocatellia bacterium]|nr:DUF1579 family protein [Blastocatellia bacterium]